MDTVHGVLDFSKIETGAFEVQPVRLSLAPIVREQVRDFRATAANKGLVLTCEIEEPEAEVIFDEYCLSNALTNLLQNAIKFTDDGTVVTRICRDAEGRLLLEVRDTGIGIDSKYLPRLGEPFSQEESGFTRRFEGTGLGLALTKSYLELNGARLKV